MQWARALSRSRGKRVEAARPFGHELLAEHEMTDQRPGLALRDLRPELELEGLAGVVQDRRAREQIAVEPGMEHAGLCREGGHRDGVLDQPAQVGVVAGARAGRLAKGRAKGLVAQEAVEQRAQMRVVHLAREMLEKALQLVHVPVGHGQELRGIRAVCLRAPYRLQVHLELVAKALHPALHGHQITALELAGEEVRVAEGAPGNCPRAIAQLHRQVGAPVARREPVLARAGVHAVDLAPGSQLGDRHRGQL